MIYNDSAEKVMVELMFLCRNFRERFEKHYRSLTNCGFHAYVLAPGLQLGLVEPGLEQFPGKPLILSVKFNWFCFLICNFTTNSLSESQEP